MIKSSGKFAGFPRNDSWEVCYWIFILMCFLFLVGSAIHNCATQPDDYIEFRGSAQAICTQVCNTQVEETLE